MRFRWLGLTGVLLLLTSLLLGTLAPRVWPTAYWGHTATAATDVDMPHAPMMESGMMHDGMMNDGMMHDGMMMGPGMMSGEVQGDPNLPFDQRFLDQMIVHHQGAVMSAQMMIANSPRPELRDLAQRIIAAQEQEIAQMRQWRTNWYNTPHVTSADEAMMEQMIATRGMMNPQQMQQMMGADVDLDQMFLQMMIPHHEAAIAMAQQAQAQAEHPELKTLAENIITTQRTEIEEMRGYLRDWYAESGS